MSKKETNESWGEIAIWSTMGGKNRIKGKINLWTKFAFSRKNTFPLLFQRLLESRLRQMMGCHACFSYDIRHVSGLKTINVYLMVINYDMIPF
jgi:hypothetical protein